MLFESGPPQKIVKLSKYDGKFASFGKEFRWTKFNAVERVMLFNYQELDIGGTNSSVKKPSELGSEKRFWYNHFRLEYFCKFFGGLRLIFPVISRVRKIR